MTYQYDQLKDDNIVLKAVAEDRTARCILLRACVDDLMERHHELTEGDKLHHGSVVKQYADLLKETP